MLVLLGVVLTLRTAIFRKLSRHLFQYRSSHQGWSIKKGVLRNFTKFTGKHLCQSLFFNKVAGLRPVTLFKKTLWHRCFPVNFVKFLGTPILQNTSGRLLPSVKTFLSLISFTKIPWLVPILQVVLVLLF